MDAINTKLVAVFEGWVFDESGDFYPVGSIFVPTYLQGSAAYEEQKCLLKSLHDAQVPYRICQLEDDRSPQLRFDAQNLKACEILEDAGYLAC